MTLVQACLTVLNVVGLIVGSLGLLGLFFSGVIVILTAERWRQVLLGLAMIIVSLVLFAWYAGNHPERFEDTGGINVNVRHR